MKKTTNVDTQTRQYLWLFIFAILILWTNTIKAEVGSDWPTMGSYEHMNCTELGLELSFMRIDLKLLQQPENLASSKWHEANNRFRLIKIIYEEKCRRLSPDEAAVPDAPAYRLPSEIELQRLSSQAMKSGRMIEARRLLTTGANAGYASAQYNLGMLMIVMGETAKGKLWVQRASQQGHEGATKALQSLP